MFAADGKPAAAAYADLTFVAFVHGYLIVIEFEKDTQIKAQMSHHLEELMEDTDLYRWKRVRAYHAAGLNQLEQYRSSWSDTDHKLRLCSNLN